MSKNKFHVLCIEDNKSIQLTLKKAFEKKEIEGSPVEVTIIGGTQSNISAATITSLDDIKRYVHSLQDIQFDAVVLDFDIATGLTGDMVAAKIRSGDFFNRSKLLKDIYIVGYTEGHTKEDYNKKGGSINECFKKTEQKELVQNIIKHLSSKQEKKASPKEGKQEIGLPETKAGAADQNIKNTINAIQSKLSEPSPLFAQLQQELATTNLPGTFASLAISSHPSSPSPQKKPASGKEEKQEERTDIADAMANLQKLQATADKLAKEFKVKQPSPPRSPSPKQISRRTSPTSLQQKNTEKEEEKGFGIS